MHREGSRGGAGGPREGGAVLRPRPDRDREDRGPHLRPQEGLHGRDRHPQHAAGRTGRGQDRVPLPGQAGGVQEHPGPLRASRSGTDREVHHREVRIMPEAAERKALESGLRRLNENMATLAELSELAIRKAIDGLRRLDPGVADDVFTLDEEIYALQLEIESTCVDLLALHAPVARDLRTITTSLKITTYLERIADHAVNIGERVVYMVTGERAPRIRAAVRAREERT